jgi:hypothetical protein
VSHPLGGQRDDSRLFTFQTSCKQHPSWFVTKFGCFNGTTKSTKLFGLFVLLGFFFEKILIVFVCGWWCEFQSYLTSVRGGVKEKKKTVGLVGGRDKGEGVAVTTQGKRDNENVLRTFPES